MNVKKRMGIDLKSIELKVNSAINNKNILNFDTKYLTNHKFRLFGLKTKSIYTVGLLIFFCLNHLQSQISADSLALTTPAEIEKNTLTDSIHQKKPTLLIR